MEHLSEAQIRDYVSGTLSDEESDGVEDHFSECEDCFDQYLFLLEEDSSLPSTFTDETVNRIVKEHPTFQQQKKSRSFAHYLVAAGLTLVLMMSGVFNLMTDSMDPDSFEQQPSLTEQILDQTGSLMDKMTNR
ncbi:zf-HC2 domain-containing protein [Halobacillus salinus]|uniref:zf-HC2 domain-containing protein n=1 Tax=Halobacillus salinus TaxID=192814 RepID=UPI0009A72CC7|nr:zf-HC2 domain-containing protein [Halobacillus salinus]